MGALNRYEVFIREGYVPSQLALVSTNEDKRSQVF